MKIVSHRLINERQQKNETMGKKEESEEVGQRTRIKTIAQKDGKRERESKQKVGRDEAGLANG